MLMSMWMIAQLVMLALSVGFAANAPGSPVPAILLLVAGALALLPLVLAVVCILAHVLVGPVPGYGRGRPERRVREYRLPGDPGTPGSRLARAPARFVHAPA
ncbi:hypothetical protein MUN78_15320 [Leucobacter allii]|uniref:Uncharacterized protein n=1 Tax=Leucobacter allii TaxID=2932247 RepID=A0ABY4FL57_9MICO|nr:hypothetical protein [Leucobacter allii]UOQ57012.1 hypothetical protein MUN78_15320 [Leucobacter allii]